MRVLFLHNHFPGHYGHVAAALAADAGNRVVFGTADPRGAMPRVEKRLFAPTRKAHPTTHHYLQPLETAVLNGQAVYRLCHALRRGGFTPDVICAHSGWGPALYVRDAFPEAPLLCHFEWYYHGRGGDADYLEGGALGDDELCRIRSRNAAILFDLVHCERGLCPTRFQRDRFPALFHPKLSVLHDGIDTAFFSPAPREGTAPPGLTLPGLTLPEGAEIVTYATRGMEPYRGFPQFMRAAAALQKRRPGLQIVVVGSDTVAYSRRPPDGQTYKQKALAELPDLDLSRLHFTGPLPYEQYRRVLRASSVHVYLTVPFVLSWSLLEAMAAGCLVVASDNEAVREVVRDGETGLLVDFFAPSAIADRIEEALDHPTRMAELRAAARDRIVRRYALKDILPRQLALIEALAGASRPGELSCAKGKSEIRAENDISAVYEKVSV